MGMGNQTQGWDIPDDDDGYERTGGSGGSSDNRGTWRFIVPQPKDNPFNSHLPDKERVKPATKRVLFIDGAPLHMWMHSLFGVRGAGDHKDAVCLRKNNISERCPLCEEQIRLQFVGFFTVVDMGFVEYISGKAKLHGTPSNRDPNRVFQFQRRILGAKKGGGDKPGVLMTLKWEAEKRGEDFTGTVWDTSRAGGKTEAVGNNWSYVDRISPQDYERYLIDLGADQQYLNVTPCDFGEEIKALSEANLAGMVGRTPANGEKQGKTRTEGAGWGGNGGGQDAPPPEDDDIPF